jgi:cell wall-associated NlpC family hydrolase
MPYVWGATGPRAFDCSGLVIWAYGMAGRHGLPRTTWGLVNVGRKVSIKHALPGDLVFTNGLGHMGIYVGHGRMLNAPHSGARVRIDRLSRFHVVTIRRI